MQMTETAHRTRSARRVAEKAKLVDWYRKERKEYFAIMMREVYEGGEKVCPRKGIFVVCAERLGRG